MTKRSKLLNNPVDRPAHYSKHPAGFEAIEVCGEMGFCLGNAFKYMFRHEYKNDPLEDLKKARWYIRRYYFQTTGNALKRPLVCIEDNDFKGAPDKIMQVARCSADNIGKAIYHVWAADTFRWDNIYHAETALYWLEKEIRRKTRQLKKAPRSQLLKELADIKTGPHYKIPEVLCTKVECTECYLTNQHKMDCGKGR